MNKFKNINNVYFVRELFYESAVSKDNVVFTLKREDHQGFPSLYRLYMEANDPTEYRFAVDHLDGWEHWEYLSQSTILKDLVQKWRKELNIRLRSENLLQIRQTASQQGKEAHSAQKYLLDGNWDLTAKNSRGRPSKTEIQQEAQKIAEIRQVHQSALERIMN